ncbi:MAG: hypothetical protein H7Z38_00670 [Rubrivivax sp.]|nr:hypothetical protein [Pyrinomonadaceae bacterium]
MVEDIFGGLLEGVSEVVVEFAGELLGDMVDLGEWGSGGSESNREEIERYKFLPKDLDK